jgi:M6 family metalloprotease-like protein
VGTSLCQLKDQSGSPTMSNAFPRASGRLVNNGVIRALIIPVSFTDVAGSGEPSQVYKSMAEGTHNFFYKQSQGKVSFQFATLKTYLNLNVSVKSFNLGSYNAGDPAGLFKAGLAAADPMVDFSQFDAVYVLPPSTVANNQIAYGPAFPNDINGKDFYTQDGRVMNGSVGGADAWQSLEGAGWKWMAHETGHLFGLFDWYTLDNSNPYGPWDIMSLNWSTEAIELNSWNRFISGWLDDNQVTCIEKTRLDLNPKEFSVEVLGVDSKKIKATMIKLSESKVLVLEARATAGLDRVSKANSGLLAYTVDVSIPSIQGIAQTHSRPGVSKALTDAPLRVGETLTIDGVKVVVNSFESNEIKFTLNR